MTVELTKLLKKLQDVDNYLDDKIKEEKEAYERFALENKQIGIKAAIIALYQTALEK